MLAAESLLRSGQRLLAGRDDAPARAGRIKTLLEYAHRLWPAHREITGLLAEVRLAEGAYDEAARAMQAVLAAPLSDGEDRGRAHALKLQLLTLRLRGLQTAAQRLDFLRSTLNEIWATPELRAQAGVEAATIYINQGLDDEARKLLRRALDLDPLHPLAGQMMEALPGRAASAPATAPAIAAGATAPAAGTASRPASGLALRLQAEPGGPGLPVTVIATLTNETGKAIPLSAGTVAAPLLTFAARLAGAKAGDPAGTFGYLPTVALAAPAYLPPRSAISQRANLDTGDLHAYLAARPLETVELIVTAETFVPAEWSQAVVRSAPLSLKQVGLLGDPPPAPVQRQEAIQKAMMDLVRQIKRGELFDRMLSARRVASLLAMHEKRDARRGGAEELPETARRPMLLSMVRALLQDASPAVRAEMAASLIGLDALDATTVELLTPLWQDSSSLARLRVLELYLVYRPAAWEAKARQASQDRDELVRLLAKAVRK